MTKTQEYLKKKKVAELGLPKMYIVYSSRDGVNKPTEHQVINIEKGYSYRTYNKSLVRLDRYTIDNIFPSDIDIEEGEMSTKDDGKRTGIGDLWVWTYYSTLSKEDADNYYKEESTRIKNKYNPSFLSKIRVMLKLN